MLSPMNARHSKAILKNPSPCRDPAFYPVHPARPPEPMAKRGLSRQKQFPKLSPTKFHKEPKIHIEPHFFVLAFICVHSRFSTAIFRITKQPRKDAMKNFTGMYAKSICGAISRWDRIRFGGTIRWLASTQGLNSYLGTRRILLKDFGKWAKSIAAKVRAICSAQAKALDIPLIYLCSASIDKEVYVPLPEMKTELRTLFFAILLPSWFRVFRDQPNALSSLAARMSISSLVRFSVKAKRRIFSIPS